MIFRSFIRKNDMKNRILNDLKEASPNLTEPGVLKRFLVVLALVIISMFAFQKVGGMTPTSRYDFNSVVLVDQSLKSIKISEDILDMDVRIKRTVDFICEIDGVKYYMLNKIKL